MNEKIIKSVKKFNTFYKVNYYNDVIKYFKKNKLEFQLKENQFELTGIIIYLFIYKINYYYKKQSSIRRYNNGPSWFSRQIRI